MAEPSLFDFMDYREYLRALYEHRKQGNRYFSYRFLGQKLGIEPSTLVRILHNSLHLSDENIPRVSKFLKFDDRETLYFACLTRFCKTTSDHERRTCFEKLVRIREFQTYPVQKDQFEYYHQWYHTPIRSLLCMDNEPTDPASIAQRLEPTISEEEAREAIALLLRLKLVEQNSDGKYQLPGSYITPSNEVQKIAVHAYQHESIRLADRALDQITREEREISTVTVTLNPQDMPALQEQIRLFRKSIMELSKESESPRMVYQLNVQLFPLTRTQIDPHEATS